MAKALKVRTQVKAGGVYPKHSEAQPLSLLRRARLRGGAVAAMSVAALLLGDVAGFAQTTGGPAPSTGAVPTVRSGCQRDAAIISCEVDESVRRDFAELQTLTRRQFAAFAGEAFGPNDVRIEFVGKAKTADQETVRLDEPFEARDQRGRKERDPAPMDAWRLFNPATRNEFQLTTTAAIRSAFNDALRNGGDAKPRVEDSPDPRGEFRALDWSGGDDSREWWPGSLDGTWGTIANMGNCTATFVGPRHVVTAGHCLYNRANAAWTTNFSMEPRRNGASIPLTTSMPPGPGQTGWYFTPVGWRTATTNARQFDFGVVVVPDRLGDTVSWMNYGALGAAAMLDGERHLVRGYPLCDSQTGPPSSIAERIDEPTNPCTVDGFYVGDPCSVGELYQPDSTGWNRLATHGCDASAANSGSALYTYLNGSPMVVGIHVESTKCFQATDSPCTAADTHPLVATRITPEYRDWISYFRAQFP